VRAAKFLRGLYYFDLVRLFGDVPLVVHDGEGEGEPRTSKDVVYEQIVADLTEAEQITADFPKLSSEASSQAASGLLSKVYITWAQTDSEYSKTHQAELYQKAVEAANKVISSGKYQLVDKFIDNWSLDKKEGPELIFTVEHKFGINRNITGHCVFSTGFTNDKLPVIAAINNNLYYEFDDHDQRRDASVTLRLFDPATGKDFDFDRLRFRKYIDTLYMANESAPYISGQNTSSSVLRYAEVLLVKAEAENELNGPTQAAYEALNAIRRRAYWNPYTNSQSQPADGTPVNLSGLSKEQFRKAIQDERYREFVTEGNRWFDLKRWHILVKTIKEKVPADDLKYQNITTRNYYLPVPEDQIVLNPNLTQNWGYAGETSGDPYAALGWE
jgi:SusD family.